MAGYGSSEVRTPIFSSENYNFWRIKMVTIFKSHGLWKLVEKWVTISDSKQKKKKKAEGSSDEEDDEKTVAAYMQDAKALGFIQSVVSDQIFPRIANADPAKMASDLLYREYHNVLSNERLVYKVLISLSKHYDPIYLVIENTKCIETVELQEVLTILKSQEQHFDLHTVDATDKAFASLSVSSKRQQNRGNSQSSGFKSQRNWNAKGKKWDSKSKFQQRPFLAFYTECKLFTLYESRSNKTSLQSMLKVSLCAITEAKVNGNWYIESWCSSYMIGNTNLLVDIRTNVVGKVQMSTGVLVNITEMGSLEIDTKKGKKYIREVVHFPGLKENLLSVEQMDERGYYLMFRGGMCSVFDGPSLNNLVIKVKKKQNICYPLSLLNSSQFALKASIDRYSTWIWHKRLGHLNLRSLKQLRENEMVHGFPYLEDVDGVCEGC
ncbi:unnamed protein product [Malus baccata var. baccata]